MSSRRKLAAAIITDKPTTENVTTFQTFFHGEQISLEIVPPYYPDTTDIDKLSALGKFLLTRCKNRFAHYEYSYMSAFGLVLAWDKVFQLCIKNKTSYVVLEANSTLEDPGVMKDLLTAFCTNKMDYLKITDSAPILVEMCPSAQKLKDKIICKLPQGTILKMMDPKTNTKGIIISPKFAQHMHHLISRGDIPPIHIDSWMSMECGPYGPGKFNSGRYRPKKGTKFPVDYHGDSKTYKHISHTTPICFERNWDVR